MNQRFLQQPVGGAAVKQWPYFDSSSETLNEWLNP